MTTPAEPGPIATFNMSDRDRELIDRLHRDVTEGPAGKPILTAVIADAINGNRQGWTIRETGR